MNNIVPIQVGYNLGQITNNLEEVKKSVQAYCDDFKNVVVTEDTVKDGKQMLANIRKEKKALDDQRKAIKKAWNAPYTAFEKEVKEVISLYDTAIDGINEQVQELEEQRKEAKRADIAKLFLSIDKPEEVSDWIRLDDIYDTKWENASTKMKEIETNMNDAFTSLLLAYKTIKMMNHPYESAGLEVLREKKDLQLSIQKMNDLKQQEEVIAAQIKASEEKQIEELNKADVIADQISFGDVMDGFYVEQEPVYELRAIIKTKSQLRLVTDFVRGLGLSFEVKEV